jgi:hypothetical protein
MTTELVHTAFDYGKIAPEEKSKLICLAGEINREKKSHLKAAMRMGEGLKSAQELLSNHKNGVFSYWVQTECGISRSTAHNYIRAWDLFKGSSNIGQYDDVAMYALSAPNAPKEAYRKSERVAQKGCKITIDVARKILDEFREKATKTKPAAIAAPVSDTSVTPVTDTSDTPPVEEPEPDFEPAEIEAAPASTVDITGLSAPYKRAVTDLARIAREFDELSTEERTGAHLADKITRIKHDLGEARRAIQMAEPVCACEKCGGAGCRTCANTGFWTKAIQAGRK